jgi:hypothetical protein
MKRSETVIKTVRNVGKTENLMMYRYDQRPEAIGKSRSLSRFKNERITVESLLKFVN